MPTLRVRTNGESSQTIELQGLKFSFAAGTRHCVGHKPFRDSAVDWLDCDNTPLGRTTKCDRCSAHDATYASYLHHAHVRGAGELPAVLQKQLARENFLYIAGFRDGSIKVGTSTSSRVETRLAEQGAWRATIVASASDGYVVREVEAQITEDLGIGQSVSIRRKLKGMVSPVDDDVVLSKIEWASNAVAEIIASHPGDRISHLNTSWSSPVLDHDVWKRVVEYPAQLSTGTHSIDVQSVSGRLAAFRRPGVDDMFIADLGTLVGIELTLTSDEPDPLTIQSSLF